MDGWIDHTPLDCCDYWSTAFQNRSADNDDDDVANSIVGFYVTTIVIMIVMMHLIQQPGLPHNYAPPSLRFTILRLLAESQATSTKRAGERTHRFLTETAKSLLSFRLSTSWCVGAVLRGLSKTKRSDSPTPLCPSSTLVFAHYSHPCCWVEIKLEEENVEFRKIWDI